MRDEFTLLPIRFAYVHRVWADPHTREYAYAAHDVKQSREGDAATMAATVLQGLGSSGGGTGGGGHGSPTMLANEPSVSEYTAPQVGNTW